MYIVGGQLGRAQLLIDEIQHSFIYDGKLNKIDAHKLLTISERANYTYGQAFAHVYLARYFLMKYDGGMYRFHLNKAKELAVSYKYFDVIIEHDLLEGRRNVCMCNEMEALSIYLQGKKTADMIQDKNSLAIFDMNIAELFCRSCAYDEAKAYYKKALEQLEGADMQSTLYYRKRVLIGLLYLSCIYEKVEEAEYYRAESMGISCDNELNKLMLAKEEIRFFLLKKDRKKAVECSRILLDMLKSSKSDRTFLLQMYMDTMELMFLLREKKSAEWCLKRLDQPHEKAYPDLLIRIQKLRIQFSEIFDEGNGTSYKKFYETVRASETVRKNATAWIFNNMVALYETDKQKKLMTKERSDLQAAADKDELTGLYNRRYYTKLISKLLQDDRVLSLGYLMIDVDYFKEYNDYYGHHKGDEVLKGIAALLLENLPQGVYAARYGGDEFSCLFTNKSQAEMEDFVQSVQKELWKRSVPHEKSKGFNIVTLSFGMYHESELKSCEESDLIKRADEALYQAKKQGRNTYAVYGQGGRQDGH